MDSVVSVAKQLEPPNLNVAEKLQEFLMKQRARFHDRGHSAPKEEPLLAKIGGWVMFVLIGMYVAFSALSPFVHTVWAVSAMWIRIGRYSVLIPPPPPPRPAPPRPSLSFRHPVRACSVMLIYMLPSCYPPRLSLSGCCAPPHLGRAMWRV